MKWIIGLFALLLMTLPLGVAKADMAVAPGGSLYNIQVASLTELRFKNMIQQSQDVSCGAAAIATLFHYYYGDEVTEGEAIESMLEIGDEEKIMQDGFSMLELKHYAESRGYVSAGFKIAEVESLRKLEVPVLSLMTIRGYKHFVVLKGIEGDQVYVADPAFGNRSLSMEQFAEEWEHVVLVVLHADRVGTGAFAYDEKPKAPLSDTISLLHRGIPTILPRPGEF
jgi:predicted double-glycine peptidase